MLLVVGGDGVVLVADPTDLKVHQRVADANDIAGLEQAAIDLDAVDEGAVAALAVAQLDLPALLGQLGMDAGVKLRNHRVFDPQRAALFAPKLYVLLVLELIGRPLTDP